jgi:hypothetical protein
MNEMNNFNSSRAEGFAAIITKAQQKDRKGMGQLAQVFIGVESRNSPIFSCFSNDNFVY